MHERVGNPLAAARDYRRAAALTASLPERRYLSARAAAVGMMAPAAQPRPDLVRRCAPFLPEGEEIQQVLVCQSAPHYAYFLLTYLTGLTMLVNSYRCVAVTGNAIYVLESTKLSGGAVPRRLVARLPRSTRIGPVSGRWARIHLLGRPHWVHHRFFAQIALADAAAPAA